MIVKTDGSDGSFEALFLCLCPVSQLLLPWLRPAAARRRNEKYRILSPRHKLRVNLHNLPADSSLQQCTTGNHGQVVKMLDWLLTFKIGGKPCKVLSEITKRAKKPFSANIFKLYFFISDTCVCRYYRYMYIVSQCALCSEAQHVSWR